MTINWSGKTTSFHHKWFDTPNPEGVDQAFRQVYLLDVQWSDCPIEVEREVRELWKDFSLGNDHSIVKWSKSDLLEWEDSYPVIIQYIREQIEKRNLQIGDDELILIHWWW